MLRPKHLIDCLRDPVHLEFFRRFAKTYHFERSVRFWKAVEVMKHIDDPKIRQVKIRGIVNQFFAKGATTGAPTSQGCRARTCDVTPLVRSSPGS